MLEGAGGPVALQTSPQMGEDATETGIPDFYREAVGREGGD